MLAMMEVGSKNGGGLEEADLRRTGIGCNPAASMLIRGVGGVVIQGIGKDDFARQSVT